MIQADTGSADVLVRKRDAVAQKSSLRSLRTGTFALPVIIAD